MGQQPRQLNGTLLTEGDGHDTPEGGGSS
jgi:hypothetical protein